MEYTIREIIAGKGRALEETDYARSNPHMLDFRLLSGDFYEWNGGKLRFKDCADVMDFDQTVKAFPPFENVGYASREKMPYFTCDLDILTAARERGEAIAVEGGPCLFGEHEVSVSVQLKGGETRLFDYASGKAYLHETAESDSDAARFSDTESLADYLRLHGGEVERIFFRQEKEGLTPQEYLSLRYPFEIAAALDGPLVIPIPDMSYRKYLAAVLEFVPESVRERAFADFDAISARITAFYLDAIDALRKRFQIRQFLCVHGGNRDALELWYDRRAAYIERGKVLRGLTRLPEKLESVKDYISMPALPFYLFGVENILEVNSMDETDSFRKCRKAHRKALRMGCILYPELLSADGTHTLYSAPTRWKEYGGNNKELHEGE